MRDLPGTIASLSERLSNLTADQATATAHADDRVTIAKRSYSRDDTSAALGEYLQNLPERVMQKQRIPLGTYRGLRFGMVLHPQWTPEVYLEGATTRQDTLSRDHHGPRAVLNALERLAGAYSSECVRVRQDLGIAESQLRDYQARLGKPFLHDAYLSELTTLRDQLKIGLSATAQIQDDDAGPSVSELAEKIKALKAAHSIEATPSPLRLCWNCWTISVSLVGSCPTRRRFSGSWYVVRRLKDDLVDEHGQRIYAKRELMPLPVDYTSEEREIHELLKTYTESRSQAVAGTKAQYGTDFIHKLLKKRLFSSPMAFATTLAKHRQSLANRGEHREPIGMKVPRV